MKLTGLIAGAALAIATTYSFSQSSPAAAASGATPSVAVQPNGGTTSQLPAGKPTNDSNKMGIAGPESAADTTAPNVASCEPLKAGPERDKCMALAKKVPKQRAPHAGGSAPGS